MSIRTLGAVFGVAWAIAGSPAAAAEPKYNVLFIAVDDLNNCLGCYGHPLVQSPNIDKLAARGVRFDRAYCQYPLCSPSRTSILSGRRPDTTLILDNNTPPRTHLKDVLFLPEFLHKHGLYTARVGKIAHGAFEDAVKWDVSQNPNRRAADKPAKPAEQKPQKPQQKPGAAKLDYRATDKADTDEPDGRTARRIVELLEEHKGKPFFIAAGFHKPHLPFVAPKKYFDLYPPEKVQLPREPADDRQDIPALALTRTAGDDKLTDDDKRKVIAAYYACVSFMDAQVGVVLDALDRLKLADKTIVVLWGDHGWQLGEHGGLWRKMCLFEESARVPLIVAVPGKKPGVSPRLVELVDLYPTLADLLGLPAPDALEGTSFVPLLDDPYRSWKKAAFTVVARGKVIGRSVRTERYRYTEWGNEKDAELYDHDTDPHEFVNLATDPRHAATLKELRPLLHHGWKGARPPGE